MVSGLALAAFAAAAMSQRPGPGEVLIQVHAVSVNRTLDAVVRAGKYARSLSLGAAA